MSAQMTMVGGLTEAPTLRFTSGGKAVINFTLAHTARFLDKNTNEWKDAGETLYMRCNLWGPAAENLAESGLDKGDQLIATGRLKQRSYETREGEKRTSFELEIEHVGPTTKNATVKVTRTKRSGGQQSGADDPWGSNASTSVARDDSPPF